MTLLKLPLVQLMVFLTCLGPRYDMFLFSTGYNGTGGYTKDGVAITACGDATTGFEQENCDFDNVFFIDRRPWR